MAKKAVRGAAAPAKPLSDRRAAAAARRGDPPRPAAGLKQADTAPKPARPAAIAAPPAKASTKIKVLARRMGYYGHERRRVGDVFMVERSQFNPSWMVEAGQMAIQRTTGKQELRRKHDEILAMKNSDRITTSEHEVENTGDNPLDAD